MSPKHYLVLDPPGYEILQTKLVVLYEICH
jgi:hypothetical protein